MGEAVAVVTGSDSTEGQGWRAPIAGWYELGGPEPVYLGPSSPVVPSVGAVPVEVTEDIVEAAAKAAADAVCPSSDYERWDRDAGEFVMQHDETGPDDAAFVSFLNTDGHRSVRGATYREVVAGAYPLIAARVRAEERQRIAAEILATRNLNAQIHDGLVHNFYAEKFAALASVDRARGVVPAEQDGQR